MGQTVLFGTDASVATPSGTGALFNAFSCAITQGVAEAVGFGDTWMRRRGTVKSASASIAGFTTNGTSNDRPGISSLTRTGSTIALTFITGCTLAFTGICTNLGLAVQFTANQNSTYDYMSDGAVTETWVTS